MGGGGQRGVRGTGDSVIGPCFKHLARTCRRWARAICESVQFVRGKSQKLTSGKKQTPAVLQVAKLYLEQCRSSAFSLKRKSRESKLFSSDFRTLYNCSRVAVFLALFLRLAMMKAAEGTNHSHTTQKNLKQDLNKFEEKLGLLAFENSEDRHVK